jgi:hypothetical protein
MWGSLYKQNKILCYSSRNLLGFISPSTVPLLLLPRVASPGSGRLDSTLSNAYPRTHPFTNVPVRKRRSDVSASRYERPSLVALVVWFILPSCIYTPSRSHASSRPIYCASLFRLGGCRIPEPVLFSALSTRHARGCVLGSWSFVWYQW